MHMIKYAKPTGLWRSLHFSLSTCAFNGWEPNPTGGTSGISEMVDRFHAAEDY